MQKPKPRRQMKNSIWKLNTSNLGKAQAFKLLFTQYGERLDISYVNLPEMMRIPSASLHIKPANSATISESTIPRLKLRTLPLEFMFAGYWIIGQNMLVVKRIGWDYWLIAQETKSSFLKRKF